jgi:hypothetical protein
VTLGDLTGLPLLMNAPCPHCEQISTRGSDAAVAEPICPQLGQTIRVSAARRPSLDVGQRLPAVVPDDEASVRPLDGPGRWEAALRHDVMESNLSAARHARRLAGARPAPRSRENVFALARRVNESFRSVTLKAL